MTIRKTLKNLMPYYCADTSKKKKNFINKHEKLIIIDKLTNTTKSKGISHQRLITCLKG